MSSHQKKDMVRLLPDSKRLISLVREMGFASSLPERDFWKRQLDRLVIALLQAKKQHKLDVVSEYFYQSDMDAYSTFVETVETLSESAVFRYGNQEYETLLVVAPVLAWTRFSIPSGQLTDELHGQMVKILSDHIFSEHARFILVPELYTIDQLPQSHVEIYSLLKGLIESLFGDKKDNLLKRIKVPSYLADGRYLIMAVATPITQPVFRWQVISQSLAGKDIRARCLENWREQVIPMLSNMMHGCVLDLLLPNAFFETCRKADQQIRPLCIHAAVNYLIHIMNISADDLRVVVGGFANFPEQDILTEYRIGFYLQGHLQIIYGVIWSVFDTEDVLLPLKHSLYKGRLGKLKDSQSSLSQILAVLNDLGVKCEKIHREYFPMEFCDECGGPLFADMHGELVHLELPDSVGEEAQLH